MSQLFTVFYSWQSDTGRRHGRDLIREAIEAAAEAIAKDAGNQYRVLIQSDTEGEPGMCNIPDTILRRLQESDAVVFDLTFVAKTASEDPKYCSNPNVLFELGYAFASIGPKRLICVMNEVQGAAAKQIFDLAHHRRPIAFTSPQDDVERNQTVASLAISLEQALRGILELGLVGGSGGDDEILHQRQLSEIESTYQSSPSFQSTRPSIGMCFRPLLFRPKRWPDAESLESIVRQHGLHTTRFHPYPPQQKGTAPMDWGIYNDTYGDPWALTYAGQCWTSFHVGGWQSVTLSELDARVSPEPPDSRVIPDGKWVMANHLLHALSTAFQFARNLSREFADSERMRIEFTASNIRGCWLKFERGYSMGPCRAPTIQRTNERTAEAFRETWLEDFAIFGKDFCDLFCRDGRVLSLSEIKSFADVARDV